jgi:hypothetical protein
MKTIIQDLLAGILFCKGYRHFLLIASLFVSSLAHANFVYYLQSSGGVGSVPYPINPNPAVSVDEVSPGVYVVQDGAPAESSRFHAMDYSSPPFPGGTNDDSGTNDYLWGSGHSFTVYTNGLWIEILNTNGENSNLWLRLHGTVSGDNYQLLSTKNLTHTNWYLGQILFNANDNYTDFSPLPTTNATKFYRAHHANPAMYISSGQYAIEPDSTNSDPGQTGTFYIYNEGSATNDVPVYYHVSGPAQNGVDYSNLTGMVVVPYNQGSAEIDIDPIADGLKPDQSIILTLDQNTNYLIDPAYYSATNTLYANPEVVPTAFGDTEFPCPNASFNINLNANDPRGRSLTYAVLTYPVSGTLTGTPPNLIYTPTNCFEGQDGFTFTASDGQFTSAVATVTLIISDPVYASSVSAQTCRQTPVSFALSGEDSCGETLGYATLSNPLYGTVTNASGQTTDPNYIYTPTGTNFTGTDSFDFVVYNECGDTATNTVTITVGDASLQANSQQLITSTNVPTAVALSSYDYDSCNTDTNDYLYTLTSQPTGGTLSGTPPNLLYTPTNSFEGQDSFNFVTSDGVWTSSVATVTIDVVAGPILFHNCNPFGTAIELDWMLDPAVYAMTQNGLGIDDFILYRSINNPTNFTAIATNNPSLMSYEDTNAAAGQTNYYVVTFEASDSSGVVHASPFSNEIETTKQNPGLLITATNFWNVVTNLASPTNVLYLQTPFSSEYTNQYPNLLPFPNALWPVSTTWSNYTTIYIPSNSVPLSQVTYSIAIDNDYYLYLNNSNAPIEYYPHENGATWSEFKSFESVAPGLLHYGTNSIRMEIIDRGGINFFSMIVSTNDCDGQ